jgi:hypothetical protein
MQLDLEAMKQVPLPIPKRYKRGPWRHVNGQELVNSPNQNRSLKLSHRTFELRMARSRTLRYWKFKREILEFFKNPLGVSRPAG